MKTNFKHLRKYSDLMSHALTVEELLLKKGTINDYEAAGNQGRQLLEGVVDHLFKYYGLKKRSDNLNNNINVLLKYGIINTKTYKKMDNIRDEANVKSHYEEHRDRQKVINDTTTMYELLYEVTYEMTAYYLTDTALQAYKSRRANKNGSRKYYGSANRVYTPAKQYNYNKRPNAYSNNNYISAGEQIRHYTPVAYNNPVVSGENAAKVSAEQTSQPNYGGTLKGVCIFVLIVAAAAFVCAMM